MQSVYFKDELSQNCLSCGEKTVKLGYWDEDLQFYLYFEERFLCDACLKRSVIFTKKMKHFMAGKWKKNA
jgi:hypothetical protein